MPKAQPSNVLEFDQSARAKKIADERAVKAAFDKISELIEQHGCRWISFGAYGPDGTMFQVYSHDTSDGTPGLEFFISPPDERKRK